MEWMLLPLKRYAQFRGRSRRKEFWMWVLFLVLAIVVLVMLDTTLRLGGSTTVGAPGADTVGVGFRGTGGWLTNLFMLGIFLPNLAVQVRRLHDTGRSGWWVLLPIGLYLAAIALMFSGVLAGTGPLALIGATFAFAGLVSAILLLVFFCLDGTRGPNRFGADPKDPAGVADLQEVFR